MMIWDFVLLYKKSDFSASATLRLDKEAEEKDVQELLKIRQDKIS